MKTFSFDLETTGTDPNKHGIHQIAAIIETPAGYKELHYQVKPRDGAEIVPEALAVSGTTEEAMANYTPMREVYRDLVTHLNAAVDKYNRRDKMFLVGYNNASFDNQFLRRFFLDNGDDYFGSYFFTNPLDVFILAGVRLIEQRPAMANFKLRTVAEALGVAVDETRLHDAMYDVTLTREMFRILTAERVMEVSA